MPTKKETILFKKPLDGALFLAELGYKLFPLKPNTKLPAFEGWQKWAETASIQKITDYGKANPIFNWAIYCGASKLIVVDVDNKNNKSGSKTIKQLIANGNALPETLTIETPTGGYHLYFTGQCKSQAGVLGEGLDVKSTGGYVVAPGSRINEKSYEVVRNINVIDIPNWLLSKIQQDVPRETKVLDEKKLLPEGDRNNMLASIAGLIRSRGIGHEPILQLLLSINDTQFESPLPKHEVETIARSISKYTPSHAQAAADFTNIPKYKAVTANLIDLKNIKKRQWVMQNRYIQGFISLIISPGGVGKSTLTMLDAVSVATGKPLSGFNITSPGAVWLYNTEDPFEELERRIAALSIFHRISLSDMRGVHITSGRDQPFILAKADKSGITINREAIIETAEYISSNNIKLLIVDPFVRTHEANENDNMQMDKIMWCFQQIIAKTNCAIGLVHHMSKAGSMNDPDMHAARGASALVNAARIAHTMSVMTEEESESFGISKERRSWYVRFDNAKANLQPPAEKADWFEKISVTLMTGDNVGTIQSIKLGTLAAENIKKQAKADAKDLAHCLSTLIEVNEKMLVFDAYDEVMTNPDFSHLFSGYKTKKHGTLHMMRLLKGMQKITDEKKGVCNTSYVHTNDKFFTYLHEEGIGRRKPKHYVLCRAFKKD